MNVIHQAPQQGEENLSPQQSAEYLEAQKRVKKIKKFYKELASWAGASVFMVALDPFLSGGITWSKFPVFFWGIFIAWEFFEVLRLQKLDKQWEDKMMRKFTGQSTIRSADERHKDQEDYSDELLQDRIPREKDMADLSDYRKLKRPWKDEDLV